MSGWEDIDGSEVLCGSPGVLGCLDSNIRELLGDNPGQDEPNMYRSPGIKQIAKMPGVDADLRERLELASELIRRAARMLTWHERGGPGRITAGQARAALKAMGEE